MYKIIPSLILKIIQKKYPDAHVTDNDWRQEKEPSFDAKGVTRESRGGGQYGDRWSQVQAVKNINGWQIALQYVYQLLTYLGCKFEPHSMIEGSGLSKGQWIKKGCIVVVFGMTRKNPAQYLWSNSTVMSVGQIYLYSKSMKTQHFYFRYLSNVDLSIKILFSSDNCTSHILSQDHSLYWLIVTMHCLKVLVHKTSYLTPCNVPHGWFIFFHRALLADWVDNIFPTSKCRYVFSISKDSMTKS